MTVDITERNGRLPVFGVREKQNPAFKKGTFSREKRTGSKK
jgi:hypothetical protein